MANRSSMSTANAGNDRAVSTPLDDRDGDYRDGGGNVVVTTSKPTSSE